MEVPGVIVREVTDEEISRALTTAAHHVRYAESVYTKKQAP